MRGQSLVREDPACQRATKTMCYDYRACALEPRAATTDTQAAAAACVPERLGSAAKAASAMRSPCTTASEKPLILAHCD